MSYLTDYQAPLSTADAHRHVQLLRETRDERINRAHSDLIDEFVTAAQADAEAPVRTPSDPRGAQTAVDIFLDAMAGADRNAEGRRKQLMQVFALACKSTDPTVRLPALALLVVVGKLHADINAAELAEEE
jgi:hypothetical protein